MKQVLIRTLVGFAVIWITYSIHLYYTTEVGKFARFSLRGSTEVAAIFTVLGFFVGLILRWRPIGEIWKRAGYYTLFFSGFGIVLLIWDYFEFRQHIFNHWRDWLALIGYALSGFPFFHLSKKE